MTSPTPNWFSRRMKKTADHVLDQALGSESDGEAGDPGAGDDRADLESEFLKDHHPGDQGYHEEARMVDHRRQGLRPLFFRCQRMGIAIVHLNLKPPGHILDNPQGDERYDQDQEDFGTMEQDRFSHFFQFQKPEFHPPPHGAKKTLYLSTDKNRGSDAKGRTVLGFIAKSEC